MKKTNSKYESIKPVRIIENTCSSCGIKSKSVNKSIKYNKYFCVDCLIEHIVNNEK